MHSSRLDADGGASQVFIALLVLGSPQVGTAVLVSLLALVPILVGVVLVVTSWLTPPAVSRRHTH